MTNIYTESKDIKESIKKHMDKTGRTITEIAAEIGVSRSALSQYLSGTYKSNPTNIENGLEEYLSKQEIGKADDIAGLKQKVNQDFFISEDAKNVIAICKSCQENKALGAIVGSSGFGKSKTLSEYARLDRVAYVECDDSMAARDLVEAIEMSVGLPIGYGSIWKRVKGIKEFFNVNRGYLLIIDEADKLITKYTQKKMEILRTIFDQSDVGMVVAGEPALESILKGYDARFANRIDFYVSLKGLSREEVKEYLAGLSFEEDAMEEMIIRATNYQTGCFRLLDRTLRNILRLMDGDTKITLDLINKASSMMLL